MIQTYVEKDCNSVTMENDINRSKVNGPSKEDGSSDDGVACTSLNGLSDPQKRHEQAESESMGDDITLHHRIVEAWCVSLPYLRYAT